MRRGRSVASTAATERNCSSPSGQPSHMCSAPSVTRAPPGCVELKAAASILWAVAAVSRSCWRQGPWCISPKSTRAKSSHDAGDTRGSTRTQGNAQGGRDGPPDPVFIGHMLGKRMTPTPCCTANSRTRRSCPPGAAIAAGRHGGLTKRVVRRSRRFVTCQDLVRVP